MKLIGISGVAQSGKDELADILVKAYKFKRVAFADKIKQFAINFFNVPEEKTINKTKESRLILQGIGESVRNELDNLYVELKKEKFENGISTFPIWVEYIAMEYFKLKEEHLTKKRKIIKNILNGIFDMWYNKVKEFKVVASGEQKNIWINYLLNSLTDSDVYVVSDVRYLNEKESIEKQKGKLIRIKRTNNPSIGNNSTHTSETDLNNVKDWDYFVQNEHTVEWKSKLEQKAGNIVRKFKYDNFFDQSDIKKFMVKLD